MLQLLPRQEKELILFQTFERFAVILFDALPVVDELLDAAAFQLCRKRKDFGHGRPTFGKKRGRVSEEKAGGLSN